MPVRLARRKGVYRRHPVIVPRRRWVPTAPAPVAPVAIPPLPELRVSVQFGSATRNLNGIDGSEKADQIHHSSVIPGGFLAADARISFAEFYAYRTTVYKYGATVKITIAAVNGMGEAQANAGAVVWEGFLTEVTPNDDVYEDIATPGTYKGTATLRALGWQQLLREREDPVPLQTRDYGDLKSTDSDPYASGFDHDDSIKGEVKAGSAVWTVEKGTDIEGGDIARIAIDSDEVNIKRIAGTLRARKGVPGGSSSPNYKVKVERFGGPGQFSTGVLVNTVTPPTSAGDTTFDVTLGVPQPVASLGMFRTGTGTAVTLAAYLLRLVNFRANGEITQADSYVGSQVFSYLMGQLGLKTTLVSATTTNVLPIWWMSGEWWDLADYVAQADAVKWAVWELAVGGEFRPWSSGNLWTVYCYGSSAHAEAQIDPANDAYSEVVVRYKLSGHFKWSRKRVYVSPNPLAGLTNPMRRRVYTFTLQDPQPDSTFALAVANTLATDFATEQYAGTIQGSYGLLSSVYRSLELARAGDRVTVPDFPGGSKTFRIYGVDGGDGNTKPTLQVGRYSRSKLARMLWAMQRKRKAQGKDSSS